ncbi:hypothetical protein ABZ805_23150 [Saccharopolyspora sp. NPDC047091]|uniref:hypothetical protein n=1 Tax=Saccharopolyspora sp. NPDC047091 TaxID=3155924 RepID=UPI0033DA4DAB
MPRDTHREFAIIPTADSAAYCSSWESAGKTWRAALLPQLSDQVGHGALLPPAETDAAPVDFSLTPGASAPRTPITARKDRFECAITVCIQTNHRKCTIPAM